MLSSRPARARAAVLLVLAAASPLLAACGDDADATVDTVKPGTTEPADTGSVEPTGVVIEVTALDNSFRPERVEAKVGDELVWVNGGRNEHNVLTIEGDEWGVEVDAFQPGDEYRHVFTEPGEYQYYCSIHGTTEAGMVGTVVVTA